MKTSVIILAAGKGTRMRSSLPKVLHPICGKPLVSHLVDTTAEFTEQKPVVVIGQGADKVKDQLADKVVFAVQEEQLGTAHAVQAAESALSGKSDLVLVAFADMPLLTSEMFKELIDVQQKNTGPMSMVTIVVDNPRGFGRIIRGEDNQVLGIVEEAHATDEQKKITELNASVYCFRSDWLWNALNEIQVSPKGEYYLTDLVEIAVKQGKEVQVITLENSKEAIGINSRVHLAEAEALMRQRINERWMASGVTMIDPSSTYIDLDVEIGQDTVILPNTHIKSGTKIGSNCQIGPNSWLIGAKISDDCKVFSSVVEYAIMDEHAEIGPYCHLRKNAHLGRHVHMGNFGEVKNSYLGPETKMGHFSYIGDAEIGSNVNIGAGTITCNYDGKNKHKTKIGDDVFIGSDTMLVAPLNIGKNASTGAGSVVTKDIPEDSIVVGVPAREYKKKEKSER